MVKNYQKGFDKADCKSCELISPLSHTTVWQTLLGLWELENSVFASGDCAGCLIRAVVIFTRHCTTLISRFIWGAEKSGVWLLYSWVIPVTFISAANDFQHREDVRWNTATSQVTVDSYKGHWLGNVHITGGHHRLGLRVRVATKNTGPSFRYRAWHSPPKSKCKSPTLVVAVRSTAFIRIWFLE